MKSRLSLATLAVLVVAGCARHSNPAAGTSTQGGKAPTRFVALSRDILIKIAQQKLNLPAAPSLGNGVTLTPAQPAAPGIAEFLMWRGDTFDPVGQGLGRYQAPETDPNFRFGIYIRPTPGRATLVDCQISTFYSVQYYVQVFAADGGYIGDLFNGSVTESTGSHWAMLIPWDSQFAQFGMFRVMLSPTAANLFAVAGCQIVPVL